MWAPSDNSCDCGNASNPKAGGEIFGGKCRRRQTIKVVSKSTEETTADPTKARLIKSLCGYPKVYTF